MILLRRRPIPQATEERGGTVTESPPVPVAPADIIEVTVAPSVDMRCARCDAQAYVEVQMHSGSRLEFCAHHWRSHESAMILQAAKIIDHQPYLRQIEKQKETKIDRR